MLRYVCQNPSCLHTFLSTDWLKFKKCEKCGNILNAIGRPENKEEYSCEDRYKIPLNELKVIYVKLIEKFRRIGLLEDEVIIAGSAVRRLDFDTRKKLLQDADLWDEDVYYKYVKTEGGLIKAVIDKRKMYYERKKREREMYIHKCPCCGNKYKKDFPKMTSMFCTFCGCIWDSFQIGEWK